VNLVSAADPRPPAGLPPGRVVALPDRGEVFVRDSGGTGEPVLLLHGWMFAADLNWHLTYGALEAAGYRVLALDHRGHGRGLRSTVPFRLTDCAADAAALLAVLDCGPAIAVGYSMGGPIAMLTARDHPGRIRGVVLCATAAHWRDRRSQIFFKLALGPLRVVLGLFPLGFWRYALEHSDALSHQLAGWMATELSRGQARDLVEAGHELRRYDARPWAAQLEVPAAMVLTGGDRGVQGSRQRELAALLHAPTFRAPGGHFAVSRQAQAFNDALLSALAEVQAREHLGATHDDTREHEHVA
jgi:pimeloyl-ACP methyl ester carboxylesterase